MDNAMDNLRNSRKRGDIGLYAKIMGVVCFCGWLSGCLTLGKDFSLNTEWIEVSKTTKQEVQKRLGVPEEVGFMSQRRMWTYYHIRVALWTKPSRKELRIFWDKNQRVHSYNLTSTPTTTQFSLFQPSPAEQKSDGPPQGKE